MFKRKAKSDDSSGPEAAAVSAADQEDDIPPMPPLRRDGANTDPKLSALLRPENATSDQSRRQPEANTMTLSTPTNSTSNGSNGSNGSLGAMANMAGTATPVRRTPAVPSPMRSESSEKRLTVGREICLNGKITACDVLVVEGTVEAALGDSRLIEIAETGVFKGSAEIDNAEIAGRFEGDLTVRGRLHVKSTGKVVGSVRYTRLEVEMGGEIIGDMKVSDAGQRIEDAAQ